MQPDPNLSADPTPPTADQASDFDGLDWGFPTEVHPMIQLGQDTFRRELPALLKTHYRQWVIYHGDRRLAFGRSATKLLREWIARGLPDMEMVVMCVEPTIPYDEDISDVITEEEAAAERQIPSQLPTEVHPMIQLGQDTFRRELPELLKTHYRQWVIYHGDRRLAFGRSKSKLVREWIARGFPDMEMVVMCVEPTIPYEEG